MSKAIASELNQEAKLTRARQLTTRQSARGWRSRFLKALRDIPNVNFACERARVSRVTAYQRRKDDAAFAEEWETALQHGIDGMERVVMDQAKNGIPRGVWMKDKKGNIKKVETVRDFPQQIQVMMLKAHKPQVYNQQRDTLSLGTQTTAPDGTKTEFVVHLSAEELP